MRRGVSDSVLIAAIGAVALVTSVGVYAFVSRPAITPIGPQPTPVVVVPGVQQIKATLAAFPAQRKALGAFYRDFATAVDRSTVLSTTGQFATAHGNALRVFVASTDYAGAPQVGAEIDKTIADAIGLEERQLDAQTKAALVAALKSLATIGD